MSDQSEDKKKDTEKEESPLAPDPKTLHKTDPQENMKGPISSIIQKMKEGGEDNDKESKEEADKKKDEST
ncbi:MAG: hypothetical protein ABJA85_05615 [Bacteroidota bacterium]